MKTPPVLFLDVDGVLNGHDFDHSAQSNVIRRDCVKRLNRILDETGCQIVLSSAWRYMVLMGAMTLDGFGYLLRSHGVRAGRLIGTTAKDETGGVDERGKQIKAWLAEHQAVTQWAVVDDMALGFDGMPIVRTDGARGLQDADADRLIEMLLACAGCGERRGGLGDAGDLCASCLEASRALRVCGGVDRGGAP